MVASFTVERDVGAWRVQLFVFHQLIWIPTFSKVGLSRYTVSKLKIESNTICCRSHDLFYHAVEEVRSDDGTLPDACLHWECGVACSIVLHALFVPSYGFSKNEQYSWGRPVVLSISQREESQCIFVCVLVMNKTYLSSNWGEIIANILVLIFRHSNLCVCV